LSRRILQFGTSRFLQAHVDLFVHETRQAGADVGPITVVKTTGDATRDGRVAALARGYPVIIRGLDQGAAIDRTVTVTSVVAALSIHRDAEAVRAAMLDADLVISNTGEAGYGIAPGDRRAGLLDSRDLPASFPAKLLQLLGHRWRNGARPLAVYPCELINRNGRVLKRLLIELGRETAAPPTFIDWLGEQPFADSLVDRIVATPLEPAGAVAEPYALWAIERQPGLPVPLEHPQVIMTDDLEPYERLKLHILNLGHTVLADLWHHTGRPADETVRAILSDPAVRGLIEQVYGQEVVPGFAANGLGPEAAAYVATTLDRFANPFLDHRIADIFGNHALKVERRIAAFKSWGAAAGADTPTPLLEGVIARAKA
jgi:tagaturonate reductase